MDVKLSEIQLIVNIISISFTNTCFLIVMQEWLFIVWHFLFRRLTLFIELHKVISWLSGNFFFDVILSVTTSPIMTFQKISVSDWTTKEWDDNQFSDNAMWPEETTGDTIRKPFAPSSWEKHYYHVTAKMLRNSICMIGETSHHFTNSIYVFFYQLFNPHSD